MTGFTDGGTRTTTRPDQPLACVIINPSKRRATTAVQGVLERELREAGYAGPVWLETSMSETGTMQARLALAAAVDRRLVLAHFRPTLNRMRGIVAAISQATSVASAMPAGHNTGLRSSRPSLVRCSILDTLGTSIVWPGAVRCM